MKNMIKRTMNLFLTVSVAVSSLSGMITVSAEAGDTLYSFDASTINSMSNSDAAGYGITADTTGTIWGITKQDSSVRDSTFYDAIRFSTRSGIGDKTIMSLEFANDSVNNPKATTFENGNYVFTTEFSSLYKNDGYMLYNISGTSGDIAKLKMIPSSGEYKYTNDAYLIDSSGTQIGNTVQYKGGNEAATGINANAFAANILYLKTEINLADKTYSAWLIQRGTDAKDYSALTETDDNLLIKDQPFCDTSVSDLAKISVDVTSSTATNGIWLHNIFIQEGEAAIDPDTQTPLERTQIYMEKDYRITDESYGNITTDLSKPLISSWNDSITGNNVSITWKSSDTSLIADDGTYTAPEQPSETKNVTMTATLSYNGESVEIPYELTIRKYTNEKLIDSEDFLGKQAVDGRVDGWELYDASAKVDTFGNLSLNIKNNKLVITKTGTSDESDYSERYKTMYRFKDTLAKDTYSRTYRTNLRGEYKVVTSFQTGVGASSQFQLANIATGDAESIPTRVFPMCFAKSGATPGVYEYISSSETPTIYKDSVNKTDVTATYYINTETGEMTAQVNNGDEYAHSANPGEGLQGMMYIIKSKAVANDTITINSIDLYRLSSYDDGTDSLYEATKSLTTSELTDTPNALTQNLKELPSSIDGAKIEWSSSDTSVIDANGAIGERPIGADAKVTLTAKITKDNAVIYKEFYLTLSQEDDMTKILEKASESITYDTLTSENRDNITKDLNSLPSSGLYGSTITWTSSDTATMSDAGKVLKLGEKTKLPVTMTATFKKNGVEYKKTFDFKIALDFEAGLTTLYKTDFSSATVADNITVTNGAGKVTQEGNQLLLTRNTTGGAETSVKIYPEFNGKKINVTGEMIVETDVNLKVGCQKAEVVLYDTLGNKITSFYTTGTGNGPASYTNVYRDTLDGAAVHSVTKVTAGVGLHLKSKVHVNIDTGKMTIYTDTDGNGYKAISTDKYMRENAANLSYIQITAVDDTNNNKTYINTGVLEVNSVKVSINEGTIPEIITNNIDYFGDISSMDGVTSGNINLPTTKYDGTTVVWTSSDPSVISNDGKYHAENFSADKNLTITFKLSLDANPEIYYEKVFDILAMYVDPNNIAIGQTAKSSVISNTGHGPEKAVDGISKTYWETMRSDDTPSLTIALNKKQVVSKIKLSEAEILGIYPVTGYVIETSNDNKKWTEVYKGTTLGGTEKVISIAPAAVSYVRYRVTSKASGNSGLNEFGLYMGDDDKSIAKADLVLLIEKLGTLTGLTQSVSLPQTGEYGSKFTYVSSIPTYFSNSGTVTRPSSSQSGTLTITSVYGNDNASDSVRISVSGISTGGGAGGGGGSSSSSSSSHSSGSVAAMPQQSGTDLSENIIKTGFNDVTSKYWGYDSIETLRVKNIVSGDANGNFRPNDNISREEFLKMLIGALGVDVSDTESTPFTDITDSDWSKPYVSKAVSIGIVQGISDDTFGKGMPITRQDMALMCIRALSAVNKSVLAEVNTEFTDNDEISSYAFESVMYMSAMGVINGYDDNSFRPHNNATRGEAAKIICKLM